MITAAMTISITAQWQSHAHRSRRDRAQGLCFLQIKINFFVNDIVFPSDLRRIDVEQLPQLCAELRKFIVDELSTNPGHLASSLGAVELTVALHYVYDTPYDRIVWDVGHQAYGHKILTGRREAFSSNRRLHGLRPFPSPEESEYDTFTCGHASNSISAALGMAVAEARWWQSSATER